MNKKNILLALVVVSLASVFVGANVGKGVPPTNRPSTVDSSIKTGSVPTLDGVDYPFITIAGQREWRGSVPMAATSSRICAIQNPFRATSTVTALSGESLSNGIGVANNIYVSTSTSAFGSSTPAMVSAFAMGTGQWSFSLEKNTATTTSASAAGTGDTTLLPGLQTNGSTNYVLGPSEWITWRIATTTAGTFTSYNRGSCSAVIDKN